MIFRPIFLFHFCVWRDSLLLLKVRHICCSIYKGTQWLHGKLPSLFSTSVCVFLSLYVRVHVHVRSYVCGLSCVPLCSCLYEYKSVLRIFSSIMLWPLYISSCSLSCFHSPWGHTHAHTHTHASTRTCLPHTRVYTHAHTCNLTHTQTF